MHTNPDTAAANTAVPEAANILEEGKGPDTEQLARVEAKLDRLVEHMEFVAARQRRMEELVDEGMPIAREAMRVGGLKLDAFEKKGYVVLMKAMVEAMDNVVESYSEDDFRALADNMVGILDVVRSLTQPEILAIADEAADALHDAGSVKPVSMLGAMRASREDEVQKGMAVMLNLMRSVGKASSARGARGGIRRKARTGVSKGLDSRLASRLAPTRRAVRTEDSPAPPSASTAASATASSRAAETELGGLSLDGNGFLADPGLWTREFAELVAAAEGVDLTDEAWAVVQHARKTWEDSGSSPNIRALTKAMGIETRTIYTLFPKAPGKTISRIAGIPKPAGCI